MKSIQNLPDHVALAEQAGYDLPDHIALAEDAGSDESLGDEIGGGVGRRADENPGGRNVDEDLQFGFTHGYGLFVFRCVLASL